MIEEFVPQSVGEIVTWPNGRRFECVEVDRGVPTFKELFTPEEQAQFKSNGPIPQLVDEDEAQFETPGDNLLRRLKMASRVETLEGEEGDNHVARVLKQGSNGVELTD